MQLLILTVGRDDYNTSSWTTLADHVWMLLDIVLTHDILPINILLIKDLM